jgi:hypothetical protein
MSAQGDCQGKGVSKRQHTRLAYVDEQQFLKKWLLRLNPIPSFVSKSQRLGEYYDVRSNGN